MEVCLLMVLWVTGSIPLDGTSELFLIPASAPQIIERRPWYVLSCLWNGAYKTSFALCINMQVLLVHIGGIAANQVIARSELEVHRQMFTE